MPIYEFTCRKCQKEFEELVRSDEKADCPACGSRDVERLMSAPAAHSASDNRCPGAARCEPNRMPCCGSRGCAH